MIVRLQQKLRDLLSAVRGKWNGMRWRQKYQIVGQDQSGTTGLPLGFRVKLFFVRLGIVFLLLVAAVFAFFFFLIALVYLTIRSIFSPATPAGRSRGDRFTA